MIKAVRRSTVIFLIIFNLSSASLFSQTYLQPKFSFCNHSGETITLKELKKCPRLIAKNKKLEIKSFLVAIPIKADQNTMDDISELGKEVIYLEYKIIGDELSKEAIAFFERPRKSKLRVSIEDVVVTENGKDNKYEGFTFYLK